MTFDDYWQSRQCEIAAEQSLEKNRLSILAADAWNAALDEAKQKLLICCCGHSMIVDHVDFGKCQIKNCDCFNACSCWEKVFDDSDTALPGRIDKILIEPLSARATP